MNDHLNKYIEKRDFSKTSEAQTNDAENSDTLRFVVQHHAASSDHYDFRLEWNGVLLSWAVPKGPSFNPRDKRLAVKVEDHPFTYRNFEGTIPEGQYGGGTVMIWDEGFWEPLTDDGIDNSLKDGHLKFTLNGKRLKGNWTLVRWDAKSDEVQENWLLIKEKDDEALDESGITDFKTSIRSGHTMAEIAEKNKQ